MTQTVEQILKQAEEAIKTVESRDNLSRDEINSIKSFYNKINPDPSAWYTTKQESYVEYVDYDDEEDRIPYDEYEMYDDDGYKRYGWMSSSTNCF